jgi:hypothetical protein
MDAYLVSHNGLGDNLFMIGALHFIRQFYKNVFFLCKGKYYENVKLFFDEKSNIICVPFNENDEFNEIKKILNNDKYTDKNTDIFVCGFCHKSYLQSKITNPAFLNASIINKNYTIDHSTITTSNYSFIENFYKDINLNLTHFYEYYDLPSTDISKQLFDSVKNYYLVFIQLKSSDGRVLNISNLLSKYINDDNVLLICNDANLYDKDHKKYLIAQNFLMNKIVYYVDVIKNSDEIYLIDSCFIGIVLPFLKMNKLKTDKVKIILRNEVANYIL